MTTPPVAMREEIDSIPAMLRREARRWQDEAAAVRSQAAGRRQWMIVGRGSSGNAALLFTYLHTARTGRGTVDLRPASLGTVPVGTYDDSVLIAYSASGQATDVTAVCDAVRKAGGLTIAVENAGDPHGLLVRASDLWITLGAGAERAVPATRSFVAQMVVSAALAGCEIVEHADRLADDLEGLVEARVTNQLADHLEPARVAVWMARGPALAACDDAALKLAETARRPAVSWSTAEVRHGPVAAMDASDRGIAFLASDDQRDTVASAVASLTDRGVPTLTLAATAENGADASLGLTGTESWTTAVGLAVASERIALELALRAGYDPDAPPGLAKVTQTF